MRIAAALILSVLVAGCARPDLGLARPSEVPALPPELSREAKRLPPVTDPTLGGVTVALVETSIAYNTVARQLNTVVRVYDCVRRSLKASTDVGECLNAAPPR